jgi:hypothetical protein
VNNQPASVFTPPANGERGVPASLRAILSHVIDYAGTFPPARLALDDAVANYLRYQRSPHAWMLGRFVCAAESLPRLLQSVYWPDLRRHPLALIGSAGVVDGDYVHRLNADLETIEKSFSGDAEAEQLRSGSSFEFRLSPAALNSDADLFRVFDIARTAGKCCGHVFVEAPLQSGGNLLKLVKRWHKKWGLKFRTGPAAEQVPSAKELAEAICLCCLHDVRFKVTAGLHQPLRHFDPALGVFVHGFLNTLCAAGLARTYRLNIEQIADVLKEESPAAFEFGDTGLRCWGNVEIELPKIELARSESMVSFGSCSFDEPVEGLQKLGLMP